MMTVETIKKEVASWDDEKLTELATFLRVVRQMRDPAFREMLSRKMDQPPEAWVTFEEAARRLGLDAEPSA